MRNKSGIYFLLSVATDFVTVLSTVVVVVVVVVVAFRHIKYNKI